MLPFHRAVVEHPDFIGDDGLRVHTRWIETDFATTFAAAERPLPEPLPALHRTLVEIDGRRVVLGLPPELLGPRGAGALLQAAADVPPAAPAATAADAGRVDAPVAGRLSAWRVADGARVAAGEPIALIEAMKMELAVVAPRAGSLVQRVAAGATVATGARIGDVQAPDATADPSTDRPAEV